MTSSSIENVRGYSSSLDLFNKIFVPARTTRPAPRAPIVDRVLANYNRLRNGNTRLSAADKQRLDDHVARIAELQRKLTTTVSGASCSSVTTPTDNANKHTANTADDAGKQLQLWNEVAAAAFMCGTSRIGVLAYGDTSRFVGVRRRLAPGGRAPVAARRQAGAAGAVVPAVLRVGDGRHGEAARQRRGGARPDLPRPLAAGVDAGVRHGDPRLGVGPGRDLRQRGGRAEDRAAVRLPPRSGNTASTYDPGAGGKQTLGLLYSQWLATVLQAMGVPPERVRALGHQGLRLPVHHEGELDAAVRASTTATRRRATSRTPASGCRS